MLELRRYVYAFMLNGQDFSEINMSRCFKASNKF